MLEPQEFMVIRDHSHMIKEKRTKRGRPVSQLSLTMATSSCSTAEVNGGGFGGAATEEDEEEDMANCLILLAKGKTEKSSEQPAVLRSNVYQCKTCNRCFPSFQALGGHRASHKKPKTTTLEEHVLQISDDDHGTNQISRCSTDLCRQENNKLRVHECSICGAEFTSGQALGGHMRRHRAVPNHDQIESLKAKKSRNLALNLNLPAAPEEDDDADDHREYSKFSFASKEQVLVFSASPLVDCHN